MSDEVEALRAEVAALRAELAESTETQAARVTRRRLLTGLGVVGAATVARATPASADDGDPVLLGESNVATTATFLTVDGAEPSEVVLNAGGWGVNAIAEDIGVLGFVKFEGVAGVWGEKEGPGGSGVAGNATDAGAIGVIASSEAGPALAALSRLDGVTLELTPAERTGPPASMPPDLLEYRIGAVSVDEDGEVWLCTSTGAPGTWTRLLREDTAVGRTIPITPVRVLDSRANGGRPSGSPAVPGQVKGPLNGGSPVTLDLAGVSPIPASATGVLGNLTITAPTQAGFLAAVPSGSPPSTSALNFGKNATIANAFTSRLGTDGLTLTAFGASAMTYHLIVDITAYIS